MKTVCIILAFLFNFSLQSVSASSVYTDKIYPTVIIGGGPAGLYRGNCPASRLGSGGC